MQHPWLSTTSFSFTHILVNMPYTKQTAKKATDGKTLCMQLNMPLQEERNLQGILMEVYNVVDHNNVHFKISFTWQFHWHRIHKVLHCLLQWLFCHRLIILLWRMPLYDLHQMFEYLWWFQTHSCRQGCHIHMHLLPSHEAMQEQAKLTVLCKFPHKETLLMLTYLFFQ